MNVFVLLNTKEDILKNVGNRAVLGHHWLPLYFFFPPLEVNGAPKQPDYKLFSKYLPLCSAEQRNSYRFGTTWGWVNDRIFIFWWTIPLRASLLVIVANTTNTTPSSLVVMTRDDQHPVKHSMASCLNIQSLKHTGIHASSTFKFLLATSIYDMKY